MGDSCPSVGGVRLGMSLKQLDSILGTPDRTYRTSVFIDGHQVDQTNLTYIQRGLLIVYSTTRGAEQVLFTTRHAGALDGARVGDPLDSLFQRWGPPTAYGANDVTGSEGAAWRVGPWRALADAREGRITRLGVELGTPIAY